MSEPVGNRLSVSGMGIVCPGAIGREAFVRAVSAERNGGTQCRLPDFSLEEYLGGARSFRRVAGVTKFALAAMALAVTDAGFSTGGFGGERAGLIVGVTHCAINYAVDFHRTLVSEGPLTASPLSFSESVPNAPAGNGAIAFQIRGPVHTLIGEEPVGTQAIELAAGLLQGGFIDRCLVVGAEEWSEVVAYAYGQIDRAARGKADHEETPLLSDGAAALVLETESAAAKRGATPHATIAGWSLGRCQEGRMADATSQVVHEAFRPTAHRPAGSDHILLPTGRYRRAARQGANMARGHDAGSPSWIELAPLLGNPAGASNLLEVAASAALISAGTRSGPGLVLSTGIEGTIAAVVLTKAGLT
jgi:Beta-ketoacyl synthase, N-terminal domain